MAMTHPPRLRVIPGGLGEPGRPTAAPVPDTHSEPPRRWPAPEALLAGYCLVAAATMAAVAVGGTGHPLVVLAVLACALLAAGTRLTLPAALGSGVIAWLYYDGFIIGRHGDLAWGGTREAWWLLALLGAALCGSALGRVRHHG
jgi:hypothetical protein